MTNMTNGSNDPVADGIARWHETKRMADEATQLCRAAQDEAMRLRGENDVLKRQKEKDDVELRQLRGLYEEMKAHVGAAGSIVLDLMEKMSAGQYRAPGSRTRVRPLDAVEKTAVAAVADAIEAKPGDGVAEASADTEPRVPRRVERDDAVASLGARFGSDNRPEEWDRGGR